MNAFDWRGPSSMRDSIVKIGRPPGSLLSDEDRAQRHRASALDHYYKTGKARRQAACYFVEQGDKDRLRIESQAGKL